MMILPELVLKRKESVNSPALGSAEPTIAQPHNGKECTLLIAMLNVITTFSISASPTEKLGTGESFV